MRPLSFLLAGAAMFVAALTVNAATVCQGKILNPVTDVCWSCVFPVKIGGKASLTTSVLPDPDTGAGGPFCTCGKGLNLRAGVTFSFWEPLRTAEIVRHAGCLPSMGGVNMGDMGLRISDHVKVHSHEPDGSMKRHTDFRQVHWYATPWLLARVLVTAYLAQQGRGFPLATTDRVDQGQIAEGITFIDVILQAFDFIAVTHCRSTVDSRQIGERVCKTTLGSVPQKLRCWVYGSLDGSCFIKRPVQGFKPLEFEESSPASKAGATLSVRRRDERIMPGSKSLSELLLHAMLEKVQKRILAVFIDVEVVLFGHRPPCSFAVIRRAPERNRFKFGILP